MKIVLVYLKVLHSNPDKISRLQVVKTIFLFLLVFLVIENYYNQ